MLQGKFPFLSKRPTVLIFEFSFRFPEDGFVRPFPV
jgi:hypothetical protein